MRRPAALLLLLAVTRAALAVPPTVSNVRVEQLRDGSQEVEVIYDLDDPDTMTDHISAVASLDGGVTWSLRVTSVLPLPGMGAPQFGPGIGSGPDKGFRWELGVDYPGLYCPDLVLRVIASDGMTFTHSFGGGGYDVGYHLIAAPDGGFLVVGSTSSFGSGGQDIWLLKTDADGNEEWQRTVGGPADEVGLHGAANPTGGYFIAATVESWGLGGSDLFLLEIDATGQPVWGQNYGGIQDDDRPRVAALPDGDILLGGSVRRIDIDSFGGEYWHGDLLLARLDSLGTPRWESLEDGPGYFHDAADEPRFETSDLLVGIIPLASGHTLAASSYYTGGDGYGYSAIWLVDYRADGSIAGSSLPLQGWNEGWETGFQTSDFQPAAGEGYLLLGTVPNVAFGYSPFGFRAGSPAWRRVYEQWDCRLHAGIVCVDGGFIAAGRAPEYPGGQPTIVRLAENGDPLWMRAYANWQFGQAWDVIECADGGILITGYADGDLLLMKVDADGNPDP